MIPHDFPSVRQIRIFAAVAASQSISGAAKAVNLSQPGVTQSVRALERRIGAALFERRGSGCYLTASGAILLAPRSTLLRPACAWRSATAGPARRMARRLWTSPSIGSPARKSEA